MKVGDKIRILFHDHPEEMQTVGTVVAVLQDGVVKATIDDLDHQLATHDAPDPFSNGETVTKKRVFTIVPANYEAV